MNGVNNIFLISFHLLSVDGRACFLFHMRIENYAVEKYLSIFPAMRKTSIKARKIENLAFSLPTVLFPRCSGKKLDSNIDYMRRFGAFSLM
jgi:hypothetical protein